ncbi:MAG: UvrD-helicase domain-containing protein [Thermotogota bacterium]|nr:UvrD-helicase domain-containing protein [Thermotogota bacterium]
MIKYKGKILTEEQESHVNTIISTGQDYAIQAPPGSGKTFLLLALARKMSGYGLSVSFNKLLAIEASSKFCSSVMCKTGHALAYGAVGYKYRKRLKKLTGKHLADTEDIGDWQNYNSPANKGYLILNTIRKYCYSSDKEITKYHLPQLTILNDENLELMQEDLVYYSKEIFSKMVDESSELPITHDVYLKIWGLTNPIIKKDYIFFDEYQDSNPVIANIIKSQDCQKIFVGDQFQQIYSWRGAVNALKDKSLDMLYITKSFRFGNAIAEMTNRIITSYYPYKFPYTPFYGNDSVNSTISYESKVPNCIICRTNKGVITQTISMLDKNYIVHILGGAQPLTYLINSIEQLKIKGYTNHPDLFLFSSYADLKEYADSPMGGDIKPVLKLITTYSRERLLNILESTAESAEEADITITTAHKAKGLEWLTVRLANDFKCPTEDSIPTTEETNILYVAASRALHCLDLSECLACSSTNFKLAKMINHEKYMIDQGLNE